jgi:hypothetical protein
MPVIHSLGRISTTYNTHRMLSCSYISVARDHVALDEGALGHAAVLSAALIYLDGTVFEVQHYAAAAHTVVL